MQWVFKHIERRFQQRGSLQWGVVVKHCASYLTIMLWTLTALQVFSFRISSPTCENVCGLIVVYAFQSCGIVELAISQSIHLMFLISSENIGHSLCAMKDRDYPHWEDKIWPPMELKNRAKLDSFWKIEITLVGKINMTMELQNHAKLARANHFVQICWQSQRHEVIFC